MKKNRLEAFTDAVIAIVMTIMVLELKVPQGHDVAVLLPLSPIFVAYVLSFLFLAIYWNNHHHMLHATECINGRILWANQHLLFWLSLIPFTTAWMGENHVTPLPTAVYGFDLLMSAVAYSLLQTEIIRHHGPDSPLELAVGRDMKGQISMALYALAISAAFFLPWLAIVIYFAVTLMWFIPDRRIEKQVEAEEG